MFLLSNLCFITGVSSKQELRKRENDFISLYFSSNLACGPQKQMLVALQIFISCKNPPRLFSCGFSTSQLIPQT